MGKPKRTKQGTTSKTKRIFRCTTTKKSWRTERSSEKIWIQKRSKYIWRKNCHISACRKDPPWFDQKPTTKPSTTTSCSTTRKSNCSRERSSKKSNSGKTK